jgi:transposase
MNGSMVSEWFPVSERDLEQNKHELAQLLVPNELWVLFREVVPLAVVHRPQGGGRRRADDREVLAAILFVACTGHTWRQLPLEFGPCWPTVYRRFAEWSQVHVWTRLHRMILDRIGEREDLDWSRRAIASVCLRAAEASRPSRA